MVVRPHCQQNKFPGSASQSTEPPPFKFDNPLSNLGSYVIDKLFLLFKYRTLKYRILISLSYHITEVVSIIVSVRSPTAKPAQRLKTDARVLNSAESLPRTNRKYLKSVATFGRLRSAGTVLFRTLTIVFFSPGCGVFAYFCTCRQQ